MTSLEGAEGGPNSLSVTVASGDALDVRTFEVRERMSALFAVSLTALCHDPDVDFDAIVGQPARFEVRSGGHERAWSGIVSRFRQIGAEERGASTYELELVPALWLATQRRNYRMFQHRSEIEVVVEMLRGWGIEPEKRLTGVYKKRENRVQYGETDFAFISRMLEDAGVSFHFAERDGETALVLSDAPHRSEARGRKIAFRDHPTIVDREHVTAVRVTQEVRPGRYTVSDRDHRLPSDYKLQATASAGAGVEQRLERFHYAHGEFQFGTDRGDDMPHGDDRGRTRTDEEEAKILARRRLEAERGGARACSFETNALDLAPGVVMSMLDHPRSDLGEHERLLVVEATMSGAPDRVTHRCEVRSAAAPYRPSLSTARPRTSGVESATVVGPKGDEIHTDELGRVRVHFHWDRGSAMDERSSAWIPVSQPWGGAGYGATNLPRIGQEVLVDFLGGNPDQPVIVGRVYTGLQKTPYKLPENKTQSGWKSSSTGGGGGYNEIMFEDAGGRELVRMQAEKDLTKLVKHDERVAIGNDRAKEVGRDDTLSVGHDRTKTVDNDETLTIGNDRTKSVGHDESATIGKNRLQMVGMNEIEACGMNHNRTVGMNQGLEVGWSQSTSIGASQTVEIGKDQSTTIGGSRTVSIAKDAAETVAQAKALSVGTGYQITVGAAMNTTVTGTSTEEVALVKTVSVGDKIEFVCGAAKIVLEKSGKITLEGTEIELKGAQAIKLGGPQIDATAGKALQLTGAHVQVTGDLIDLN